jgi:hypothetical protein
MLLKCIRIQKLHVFTNDVDWYVAFDKEDVKKAYEEYTGDSWDESYDEFYQLSDFGNLSISSERESFEDFKKHAPLFSKKYIKNDYGYVKAKNWQWILDNGRGFLCSTEF